MLLPVTLNYLGTMIRVPAFVHVITEGTHAGDSPVFLLMCNSGSFYDALRQAVARAPLLLSTIIRATAFVHVAREEGGWAGCSPVYFFLNTPGLSFDALRNAVARDLELSRTIVLRFPELSSAILQCPAFRQVNARGTYRRHPLYFFRWTKNVFNSMMP